MSNLFTSATTVIVNITSLLKTTVDNLVNNPIFELIIGILILGEIIHIIFTLIKLKNKKPSYQGGITNKQIKEYQREVYYSTGERINKGRAIYDLRLYNSGYFDD